MALNYITPGSLEPEGLQNVFLSGTEADIKKFGRQIADEILRIRKCCIWHNDFTEDIDDIDEVMEKMSLAVFVVSKEFLSTENSARRVEFPAAVKKGIPVLPIAVEKNLNELFYKTVGNIQYLTFDSDDETADSFRNKLHKLLVSILASSKLAEAIKTGFSKTLFLSYRKKDRAYARTLIGAVHSCRELQDVCIWFDEYLIPGEKYTEALEKQIEDADAEILLVTPSVLEKDNYIHKHEYPSMLKNGKKVIAVELVPTDRGKLAEMYGNIEVIDGSDGTSVISALKSALGITAADYTPDRLAYVGASYINGFNSEINLALGKKLLTEAAEADAFLGMEILINMYRNGYWNEKISYEKTIYWEKRAAELIKQNRVSAPYTEGQSLYSVLLDLGEDYAAVGNTELAVKSYEESLEYTGPAFEKTGNLETGRCYGSALEELGNIYFSLGRYKEAISYHKKSLDIREKLSEITDEYSEFRTCAISYIKLAQTYVELHNIKEALDYATMAIVLVGDTYRRNSNVKRDMADAYLCMGDVQSARRDRKVAVRYYEEACYLFAQGYEEDGDISDLRNAAYCQIKIGENGSTLFHRKDGIGALKKGVDLYAHIWDLTRAPKDAFAYARVLYGYSINAFDASAAGRALKVMERLCMMCPDSREFADFRDGIKKMLK